MFCLIDGNCFVVLFPLINKIMLRLGSACSAVFDLNCSRAGVHVKICETRSTCDKCDWIEIYHSRRFNIIDIQDTSWQRKMFKSHLPDICGQEPWNIFALFFCDTRFQIESYTIVSLLYSTIHNLVHCHYQLASTCCPFKYVCIRI